VRRQRRLRDRAGVEVREARRSARRGARADRVPASVAARGELARAAGFATALVGFGFSAYLTYRELFTIHAICQWCVASAVLMTALVVLTGVRFLREPAGEYP
jgi:vitamin K epoxide reductase family protein